MNFLACLFEAVARICSLLRAGTSTAMCKDGLKKRDEKLKRNFLRRMVFEKLSAIAKKSTERAVVTRVFAYALPSFDKLSGYLRGGLRSVMLAFDCLAVSPTMPVCMLEFGR